MDQESHQIFLPRTQSALSAAVSASPFWSPSNLATALFLPLTRLVSSALNHHTVLVDDDDANDADDVHDQPLPLTRDCLFSTPFLVLVVIWNLAFILVAAFMLFTTVRERPSTPLRLWIAGYALQCLLHVGFVWIDYQRNFFYGDFYGPYCFSFLYHRSFIKRLEFINTVISSVWWVFGFYWIVSGGQALLRESPCLYWLSVVFLALDVFFMIFCIAVAFIAFSTLFCCFPILATVAYALTIGEGASLSDIRTLPKYRYCQSNAVGTLKDCEKQEANLIALSESSNMPTLALDLEDSECCICLHTYVDGVELCTLPCNHHFHHRCIRKWLRINATCPLCKFNIIQGETLV